MVDFFQIFVRLLDAKTLALQLPLHPATPTTAETLKHLIEPLAPIPAHLQTLTLNGKILSDRTPITPSLHHSTFLLSIPLHGGKGGFGSLLRGAATKAGQKKTNNFDACRDMSGRRLRHVNAEKKIEEWMAGEEERKLVKLGETYIKEKSKAARKKKGGDGGAEKYVQKYREDSAKCVQNVERSVRESAEGLLIGKKKRRLMMKEAVDAKKAKIWMGKRAMAESDSDDTDEDDNDIDGAEKERSVVIDHGSHSDSSKELEGSSHASSAKVLGVAGAERLSESGSEEENNLNNGGSSEALGSPEGEEHKIDQDEKIYGPRDQQVSCSVCEAVQEVCAKSIVCEPLNDSPLQDLFGSKSSMASADVNEAMLCKSDVPMGTPNVSAGVPEAEDSPINLDDISSATELEAVGLEKLKTELQTRGLKCGGTLQERAARLFLLKTTPIEKLPKKLLAKK